MTDDSLKHFGVKGMRWGRKRGKQHTTSQKEKKNSDDKKIYKNRS